MLVIGATGCLAWLLTVEQVAVHSPMVRVVPRAVILLATCPLLCLQPLPRSLPPLCRWPSSDLVTWRGMTPPRAYTPPVGGTLFVAAKLANAGIGEVTRALWPLLLAAIAALFVITYVPSLTTVVWRLAN